MLRECYDRDYSHLALKVRTLLQGTVIGTYDFTLGIDFRRWVVNENNVLRCDGGCIDVLNRILPEITDLSGTVLEELEELDNIGKTEGSNSYFAIEGAESETDIIHLDFDTSTLYRVMFREKGFSRRRHFSELSAGIQRIIVIVLMACSARYIQRTSYRNLSESGKLEEPEPGSEPRGSTVFIAVDELCYSFHPKVASELIELLHSDEAESGNIQLLITAHDTNLMSTTVRNPDEVYIVERDDDESQLIRLSDFDVFDVSHSSKCDTAPPGWKVDIRAAYLEGRFGGVPRIGNTRRLL